MTSTLIFSNKALGIRECDEEGEVKGASHGVCQGGAGAGAAGGDLLRVTDPADHQLGRLPHHGEPLLLQSGPAIILALDL